MEFYIQIVSFAFLCQDVLAVLQADRLCNSPEFAQDATESAKSCWIERVPQKAQIGALSGATLDSWTGQESSNSLLQANVQKRVAPGTQLLKAATLEKCRVDYRVDW